MSQLDIYNSENLSEKLSEKLSDNLLEEIATDVRSVRGKSVFPESEIASATRPDSVSAPLRERPRPQSTVFSPGEKKQSPKKSFEPTDIQNADSSDLFLEEPTEAPTEAPTEDATWTTVNLPNAISVDDLEVAPEEDTDRPPEATESLSLEYQMQTLAQRIEAQKLVASSEERSSSQEAELSARVEYLENLLSQYRGFLEDQQLNAEAQEAELDEKIRALQVAQAQINHLTEELAVCQETIQDQWQEIAELSKNWQQSQERLAQLERECATTQQRYKEQVHLNIQATNTCRELRARLNRQQRQALQFKAALEKSLENQESALQKEVEGVTPTHSLQEVFSVEIVSDRTEDAIAVSPGGVVPKSVPIQPWYTTASKTSVFELEEKRERMMETPELPSSASFSSGSAPALDRLESAHSLSLPMVSPRPETQETQNQILNLPEEDNLIQTIRDMVRPEPAKGSILSESGSEINSDKADLPISAPGTELANSLASSHDDYALASSSPGTSWVLGENYLTEFQPNLKDDSGNSPSDLPEVLELADSLKPIQAIAPQEVEPTQNWPAPVVYPERSAKKRRSLASVELPRFPTK
jgi:hypothetical protein